MIEGRGGQLDAGRWLSLLESVTAAESLDAAASEVARQFASVAQADATGVIVLLHGRVFLEYWYPDVAALSQSLHAYFHRLAVATVTEPTPSPAQAPERSNGELVTRAYVLPMKNRLTGVLCIAHHPNGTKPGENFDGPFERVIRLVALRLATLQELEAERTKRGQYEHWFRTSDRQVRTLEGERQKFAALVNSIDTCVFVGDRMGSIRWTSRSLLEQMPAGAVANSWLGRPCRDLCRSVAGGTGIACGDCLLARAAASGKEVAHQPMRASHRGSFIRLTALPIKDLEGHAQEVLVVLEGLSRNHYPRAA